MIRSLRKLILLLLVFSLLFVFTDDILCKKKVVSKTSPELRLKWYQQHVKMNNSSLFKNLNWQFLGPLNVSGRMTDLEVVSPKGKNYTIYVAGASGGIWKTVNEGTSWEPIFEHAASTSIGDIALDPNDQNIIWAGTGEANIFRSSQVGAGIYRSKDGGKNWMHLGLTDTNTIARIIIDPNDSNTVYVAASGHEWTNNKERGVFKTVDGGKTWSKIKYIDDKTGAIDLIMHPSNSKILYAAFWQRVRKRWNDPRNEDGYKGSGIFKTVDGGKTWKPVNNGLPVPGYRGRIGIDLCKNEPEVLYAFVDNYEVVGKWDEGITDSYGRPKGGKIKGATLYRSNNGGDSWNQVSKNDDYMMNLSSTYGWVFGQVRVDPNNRDRVFLMGIALHVSEDGGKNFKRIGDMHGDHHGLWIDPDNSRYMVNVNDGGVAISYDMGVKWRKFYNNLPLVQFFNVMYDMSVPFNVYGSIQDHGSRKGVVDLSKSRWNIPAKKWDYAPGGEGSNHAIDPENTNIVYSAGFYGTLTKTDLKTGKRKTIVPRPAKGEAGYRGQWIAPFIISPHNNKVLYLGLNYLFKSEDSGNSFKKISKDLSFNDSEELGDIPFQTIFSISESPLVKGTIYAGTDDGRVHISKNDGRSWKVISKGLAYKKWVSEIVASKYNKETVYLTQNGKRYDDFKPYIWKSTNYGRKWSSIVSNIPSGPVNVIKEDPKDPNILYVGTDFGVYVSIDGGKHWDTMPGNFPTTYVQDIVIHPRENIMVAATHGRGMYAVDVKFIQEIAAGVKNKKIHLFRSEPAKLPSRWGYRYGGIKAQFGYYLKDKRDVTFIVKNKKGDKVKTLNHKGQKGLNFIVWDLKKDKGNNKEPYISSGKFSVEISGEDCKIDLEVKKRGR